MHSYTDQTRMGVRCCFAVFLLAFVASGLALTVSTQPCAAENAGAIKEFGTEKSKPINSGFFFYKYAYVEAPYVVERRGLGVFVNDILVSPGVDWPPMRLVVVKDDPGEPPAGWSPWNDETNYGGRKWRYLSDKYDLGHARRLIMEIYKRCSDVQEASLHPLFPEVLVVKSAKGQPELHHDVSDLWKYRIPLSRQEALENSTHTFGDLQTTLRCGCLLREVELGDEAILNQRDALKILAVMFSGADRLERAKALEMQGVLIDPEMARLVTECPHNEQLAKRYERLKKGEVEEDPVEPPAPAGDVQAGQIPQSKALPYAWLGGGLALVVVVVILVAWRLKRK